MQSRYERHIPQLDIDLFNAGIARRAWLCFGCHHIPALNVHRFILWAPNARRVSLVGDFNGWDNEAMPMERLRGGAWICFVPGLEEGMLYKYAVTGADAVRRLKADPFARWSQTRGETSSIVYNEKSFDWADGEFLKARGKRKFEAEPMSVYEVHAGSWKSFAGDRPAYRQLGDELSAYCRDMGYTHVEFLPLTEHPFDGSWGYQVTGYYAPTSRYGSPEDFKYMVDRLHAAGIGVIMDWVPAHFPKDEHGLVCFDGTPLFECKDPNMAEQPEWGTMVFDYTSPQVQSFLVSSACMFFEEYHVDGLRVDAVASMLYLNFGRRYGDYRPDTDEKTVNPAAVDFFKKLNGTVRMLYPGVITIAEDSSPYPKVTGSVDEGGLGFCFKWDMGYMHDTLDYMSAHPKLRPREHHKLTFSMMYAFDENYVLAYSHDEVVYGKRAMLSKMPGDYRARFSSLRLLYAYQFAHPGKKHCFMGSDFAQTAEWDYDGKLDWKLLEQPMHEKMRLFYRELNRIYTTNSALYRVDRSWDGFKWLNVNDAGRCSIAFLRSSEEDESCIVCACNFSSAVQNDFVIGLPAAGTLEEILNSDDLRFGGSGILNKKAIASSQNTFLDFPNSAELTLPPLSAVMFRFIRRKQEDL